MNGVAILAYVTSKRVLPVGCDFLEGDAEHDLRFAHGGIYFDIGNARTTWSADEEDITTQAAPFDLAFHFASRVRVGVRKENAFERHRHDEQAENLSAARAKVWS